MEFDDSGARQDWGWRNQYDLDGLVKVMFQYLAPKFGRTVPVLYPNRNTDSPASAPVQENHSDSELAADGESAFG